MEVEGITWNENPKYELRYRNMTNDVHLFMPLLDPTCHFYNLQ